SNAVERDAANERPILTVSDVVHPPRSAAPRPRRVNVGADEAWHHGIDSDAVRPCTAQGDSGCVRAHRGGRRGVALPAKPLSRPCHQCVISRLEYEEESMSEVDGATLIARSLKQQGIDHLFGVVGFPVTPIAAAAQKEGVAYIGMRNEQAASYAAQAYGYLTGRPGACIVVTGHGLVHGLAGLANAQQNCWPMILFGGASETYRGGMGAFQEERQVLIASPFCKFAHGIESVQRIPYYV